VPVVETFVVPARGVGKPDYSKEISAGRTRPGVELHYGESFKNFILTPSVIASPLPYVVAPIAIGANAHLIDPETGLAMPYTSPVGYLFTVFQITYGMEQDADLLLYVDTAYTSRLILGESGVTYYESAIAEFSTSLFDPTAALPHIMDFVLDNKGGAVLEGGCAVWCILAAVGTAPLPETKLVRCKFCGHQWEVPYATTTINCPSCGKLNMYFNLRDMRKL